ECASGRGARGFVVAAALQSRSGYCRTNGLLEWSALHRHRRDAGSVSRLNIFYLRFVLGAGDDGAAIWPSRQLANGSQLRDIQSVRTTETRPDAGAGGKRFAACDRGARKTVSAGERRRQDPTHNRGGRALFRGDADYQVWWLADRRRLRFGVAAGLCERGESDV